MYQQPASQPRDEGNWSGQEYQAGYAGNPEQRDQLADAIARRLQSQTPPPANLHMPQNIQFGHSSKASAGQRIALAIVSVVMLVPLSAITLALLGAFAGLIGLGIVGAVILGINVTFNNMT